MELRLLLTASCNFSCGFCLNEYWPATSTRRVLTPGDYVKLVSAGISAISTREVTLTGGEPTLCSDLAQIIRGLSPLQIHLTMVSNGFLLERHLDALGELHELHVSFHSWHDDAWREITGSRTTPKMIAAAIRAVRKAHPELPIKLNVVAGTSNMDAESISKYVAFAVENNLGINVYRQSNVRTSSLQGEAPRREVISDWWDLALAGAHVVRQTSSGTTYQLEGATITLAKTSTDASRWSSVWVSPDGKAYVDILHQTPDVPILDALRSPEPDLLRLILFSLSSEAALHRMGDESPSDPVSGMLHELTSHRESLLHLIAARG